MISVDTVYQKVLALANKEQRGYITPQEFNLLIDKAQKDIVNNYFHGVKVAYRKPKNQSEGFDEVAMLKEKLHYLRTSSNRTVAVDSTVTPSVATITLPNDLYKIATIYISDIGSDNFSLSNPVEIELVDNHDLLNMMQNPLTTPSYKRPVYTNSHQVVDEDSTPQGVQHIQLYPASQETNDGGIHASETVILDYWRMPQKPSWGYVVVNGRALYNTNSSKHILLHPSDEETIVTRVLELAGIVIKDPMLSQMASGDKVNTKQEQNS